MMKSWIRGALALLVVPTLLTAQEQGNPTLSGGISETGLRRVVIAVPMFSAGTDSGARALALEVTRTLRSDLEASGYFAVVPPKHYRLIPASAIGAEPEYVPTTMFFSTLD